MIETKTFFLKYVVKDSCTVVEFRVSLEEKKTDGKVFIVHKNIRVTRRSRRPLPTPPRENS